MGVGYKILKEIFRGKKRVVYRGRREGDKQSVIIKTLIDDFPAATDLVSLKREYEILRNLHVDGIAKVYALEKYLKGLALILEDIGGEPLRNLMDSEKQIPHSPFVKKTPLKGLALQHFSKLRFNSPLS